MDQITGYTKYTEDQLEYALRHTDGEKYPDRLKIIIDEIEDRRRGQAVPAAKASPWIVLEKPGKYQTFWARFRAGLLDSLVFLPFYVTDKIVWHYQTVFSEYFLLYWLIVNALSPVVYAILMHGRFGQTLGKMATHVKVLDVSEAPLTVWQATKRDSVFLGFILVGIFIDGQRILSGINLKSASGLGLLEGVVGVGGIGWFLAEVTTMLFNAKRRAVHDSIAGSVVVKLTR